MPNGTPSHEILHLADNADRYDTANRKTEPGQGNNIMNVVPGTIYGSNVQEILDSRNNIFLNEGG